MMITFVLKIEDPMADNEHLIISVIISWQRIIFGTIHFYQLYTQKNIYEKDLPYLNKNYNASVSHPGVILCVKTQCQTKSVCCN